MEASGTWTRSRVDDVCVLTFDRPGSGMIRHRDVAELDRLLAQAAVDGEEFVVLTGTGDVFIRHADLEDLVAMADGRPTSGDPNAWIRVLKALDRGPFMTVAAINGQAWGGGLELALTCNLRVIEASATLAFPEVSLGILAGVAAHRVAAALPEGRAIELFTTGRVLAADEALAWGLVSDAVPDGQALSTALDLCRAMRRYDHASVLAARDLVLDFRDLDERARRRLQSQRWDVLATRPEARARSIAALEGYARGEDSRTALGITDWTPHAERPTSHTQGG
jgi:enoyl-CoA hydratase/carnithine racemase